MVEAWPHVQLFHGGRGSVCHIGRQFCWKRKYLRLVISFGFGHQSPVTEEKRKRQRSKNNKCRRMEKKEKLENAKQGVKIRFVLFISFLFCGLSVFWDCIFGFVVRMRDKMKKFNKENGTTLLLFLIFSNFDLTHETRPWFSNPNGLTVVRMVHCIFGVQRVLGLKEPSQGTVPGEPGRTIRSGPNFKTPLYP